MMERVRRTTVRLNALVALAMLGLSCAGPQTEQAVRSGRSTNQKTEQPSAGDGAARDFSVTSFSGKDFMLSAHRGSPVVLNFFESW